MSFGIATGAFVDERDDWDLAIARARHGDWQWLELTAMSEERLDTLLVFLEVRPHALDGFQRVSVHAPVLLETSVPAVIEKLERLPPFDLVVHPDVYGADGAPRRLGSRVVVENMDVQKGFGRSAADLDEVFRALPEAGFCLDVAHVWTNDPALRLGHELIDVFAGRLRQLHVSGIDADGTHRPTTVADLDLYAPLLDRCAGVPWILEAELA